MRYQGLPRVPNLKIILKHKELFRYSFDLINVIRGSPLASARKLAEIGLNFGEIILIKLTYPQRGG